jgi:hypothetical protein
MPITLTPIAYLLRGGPEHHSVEDKDPYIASGVVTVVANVAYVSGACGEMPRAETLKAIRQIKKELGVSKVVWDRANGKRVEV